MMVCLCKLAEVVSVIFDEPQTTRSGLMAKITREPFVHTELRIGNKSYGYFIGSGLKVKPISQKKKYVEVRLNLTPKQKEKLQRYIENVQKRGKTNYPHKRLFDIAINLFNKKTGRKIRKYFDDRSGYICTEFVGKALRYSGIPIKPKLKYPELITAGDIWDNLIKKKKKIKSVVVTSDVGKKTLGVIPLKYKVKKKHNRR